MAQVKKPHLKDKKIKERTDAQEESEKNVEIINKPPTDQQADDEKMLDKHDVEMDAHKTTNPKRIWSKRSTASSKSLYEIASTPQRFQQRRTLLRKPLSRKVRERLTRRRVSSYSR